MEVRVRNVITPTALSAFDDCKLKWAWYNTWSPVGTSFNLLLGIAVHEALAAYYASFKSSRLVDPVKVLNVWLDKKEAEAEAKEDSSLYELVQKARTLGTAMLDGYTRFWADNFEVIAVEKTVRRPLPGMAGWELEARIDTVVQLKEREKPIFVLEHKTYSSLFVDYLEKDHQFVAEAWLAEAIDEVRKTGAEVAGVLYNGLRSQLPSSRVKNPLFERHYIYINGPQVEVYHKRARAMARAIDNGQVSIYPSPSSILCRFCSFKGPCTSLMKGEDYLFALERMYVPKLHAQGDNDERPDSDEDR